MSDAQVGIIMGSKSDLEVMKQAGVVLKQFGVPLKSPSYPRTARRSV